tara:strand:- start:325 stop:849 length:525 start_codon:yes stop_codon:yes gene_type:complete
MGRIDIVDNFLSEDDFNSLSSLMFSWDFPWYYNDFVVDEDSLLDDYQFTHTFFNATRDVVSDSVFNLAWYTQYHNLISPIIEKLSVKKLERIKANVNPRTSTHQEGGFHIDFENITTSILYMNTNNGWTEFEVGDKIECIKNRLVTFDSNLMHSGYTCTDQKIKMVINFNYGTN